MKIDKYLKALKESPLTDSELIRVLSDASVTTRAFDKLSEYQQRIIDLRYEDGNTYKQIASIVGSSDSKIRADLSKTNRAFFYHCRHIKLHDENEHLLSLEDNDQLIMDQKIFLTDIYTLHKHGILTLKDLAKHCEKFDRKIDALRYLRLFPYSVRELTKVLKTLDKSNKKTQS